MHHMTEQRIIKSAANPGKDQKEQGSMTRKERERARKCDTMNKKTARPVKTYINKGEISYSRDTKDILSNNTGIPLL